MHGVVGFDSEVRFNILTPYCFCISGKSTSISLFSNLLIAVIISLLLQQSRYETHNQNKTMHVTLRYIMNSKKPWG